MQNICMFQQQLLHDSLLDLASFTIDNSVSSMQIKLHVILHAYLYNLLIMETNLYHYLMQLNQPYRLLNIKTYNKHIGQATLQDNRFVLFFA